jgi:hypothetical protein
VIFMTIRSQWTSGGLEFYPTGTTSISFTIPNAGQPELHGRDGAGFDQYIYSDTAGAYIKFDKTNKTMDFNGINIFQNDAFRTDTTGTATTAMVTLLVTSPRWQSIAPSSASGDVMVKLPAASESGGISFVITNGLSTGTGWAGGSNLILTTTGMGATTGTVLDTLVQYQTAQCFCDGLTWRILAASS